MPELRPQAPILDSREAMLVAVALDLALVSSVLRNVAVARIRFLPRVALLVAPLTPACGRSPVAPQAAPRADPAWVTGTAAAALGPDGRFVLPMPAVLGPGREIGETAARAQAVAWARAVARVPAVASGTVGGLTIVGIREPLERAYGGRIDFAALRDCGRAYRAEAAYDAVPAEAPAFVHNGFGARWIVRLCAPAGDVPVVLAVAAASDLTLEGFELAPSPTNSGSWFQPWGLARGTRPERAFPNEPETAVALAYQLTGRRVSGVPLLVQAVFGPAAQPVFAQCSHWRLALEAPVRVTGLTSGRTYETREVAVGSSVCPGGEAGAGPVLLAPAPAQPDTAYRTAYPLRPVIGGGAPTEVLLRLSVRTPYLFERVVTPPPDARLP